MKNLLKVIGYIFISGAFIFLLLHQFIVTSTPGEDFSRDILFNLPIPHPPQWTTFIPYLGGFLGVVFEFFSLHGLVGIAIFLLTFGIGSFLLKYSNKNDTV